MQKHVEMSVEPEGRTARSNGLAKQLESTLVLDSQSTSVTKAHEHNSFGLDQANGILDTAKISLSCSNLNYLWKKRS